MAQHISKFLDAVGDSLAYLVIVCASAHLEALVNHLVKDLCKEI
jgi:hypothetical protein